MAANGEDFDDAASQVRELPGLGVGIHLSRVGERPIAPPHKLRGLIDSDGRLPDTSDPAFSAAKYEAIIWMVFSGLRMSWPSIPSNKLRARSTCSLKNPMDWRALGRWPR
jgi:hypothetical protein